MEEAQIDKLAQKISEAIAAGSGTRSIKESIEALSRRIDELEKKSASEPIPITRQIHPSQEKLSVAEAIVDRLFGSNDKEKACELEPSKPCDHCSMCSTRGF